MGGRGFLSSLTKSASRSRIGGAGSGRDGSTKLPPWSPKQRQMLEVYVLIVQRVFRMHLARRAAEKARLLRMDPELLLRLHDVWLRRERKAIMLIQERWRDASNSKEGMQRMALRRVQNAVLHKRERQAAGVLREAREKEAKELRAVLRLQAAFRRLLARKLLQRTARHHAMGLLREVWGANKEARAVGRVQRAWLANAARRQERAAAAKAEHAQARCAPSAAAGPPGTGLLAGAGAPASASCSVHLAPPAPFARAGARAAAAHLAVRRAAAEAQRAPHRARAARVGAAPARAG